MCYLSHYWHQTQLCYIAVSLCWHCAIRKLLLGCDAGVVGQLWPVLTTISCPNTTTQHMTYMDRMPHKMIQCGMQVSTCDGCAVGKHGKGLWCGAGMCGHMCSPMCAPKCTNLCTPPKCGANMAKYVAHLGVVIRAALPDPLPAVSHLDVLPAPPNQRSRAHQRPS